MRPASRNRRAGRRSIRSAAWRSWCSPTPRRPSATVRTTTSAATDASARSSTCSRHDTATKGAVTMPSDATGDAREEVANQAPDVETLAQLLADADYLVDEGLATSIFLGLGLPRPLRPQ